MTLDDLEQIQMLDELINAKLAERQAVWEMVTKITPNSDDMPHASGVSDKVGNGVVKLVMLAKELDQLVDEYVDLKRKVFAVLEKLPPEEYGVLHRRYVRYMRWGDIAADMGYSSMQIWRIKNRGLALLEKM